MQKILIILATVLSLAAAAIGYVNRTNFLTERKTKEDTQAELASTQQTLKKSRADLKAANEKIADLSAEVDKDSKDNSDLQASLDKAKADIENDEKQMADKDNTIAQNKIDLDAKDARIKQLEDQQNSTNSPQQSIVDDLNNRLKEKQLLLDGAQAKLKDADAQIAQFRKQEDNRRAKIMRKGLEGKILAVNSSWNFVVISLGDRNGVVENAEMLIKRGDQLIGKVRITSAEPSTSIADIVVNSVAPGQSVQPGDTVIYNGPTDDSDSSQ
jgi:predicted RNase H-like nuclease (RuvC/YqgF family)